MCLHLQRKARTAKDIGIVLVVLVGLLVIGVTNRGKPLVTVTDDEED